MMKDDFWVYNMNHMDEFDLDENKSEISDVH